jgi:hypothetical protein
MIGKQRNEAQNSLDRPQRPLHPWQHQALQQGHLHLRFEPEPTRWKMKRSVGQVVPMKVGHLAAVAQRLDAVVRLESMRL